MKQWTGWKEWVYMGRPCSLTIYKDESFSCLKEGDKRTVLDASVARDIILDRWFGFISWSHGDVRYSLRRNRTGEERWYKNSIVHRDGDRPAIIDEHGISYWYQEGELHRDRDLPSLIGGDGTMEWHQKGVAHRDTNQPARILVHGKEVQKQYLQHGVLHNLRGVAIQTENPEQNECRKQYYIEGLPTAQRNLHVIRQCATKWIHALGNAYGRELSSHRDVHELPNDLIHSILVPYLY